MKKYEETYYKGVGTNYMSGLPLPADDDGHVRNSQFIRCEFHPECERTLFEDCVFIDCLGLPYLNLNRVIVTCLPAFGGMSLDIPPFLIVRGEIIEKLAQSNNLHRRLYTFCTIRYFEAGSYWPAMDHVLIMRYVAED